MNTPYTLLGEPVIGAGEDIYVVTYPQRITAQQAEWIKTKWREAVGEGKQLVILDSGAQITRLGEVEPTPIYDTLRREFAWAE